MLVAAHVGRDVFPSLRDVFPSLRVCMWAIHSTETNVSINPFVLVAGG